MAARKPAAAGRVPPIANPDRGEDTILLGGEKYRLRPSHQAIRQIEVETEKTILQLAIQCAMRALKIAELEMIVLLLIRAGAEKGSVEQSFHAERIGELIYERGTEVVQGDLAALLRGAATGGRTAEGEAVAAPATKATAGAA